MGAADEALQWHAVRTQRSLLAAQGHTENVALVSAGSTFATLVGLRTVWR
ncbi:hypothetical protein [Salinibacterium sp.]|nr:hypothetical protein [Salinibacterium sp.]